jgi:hypothetical protein
MLKIGTSKMGSVVDCPRCHKTVVVPPQSVPEAEQIYQMLKAKHSKGTSTSPAAESSKHTVSEPTAPESALDELGSHIDDADLNRWIDELWTNNPKKSPGNSSILFPGSFPTPTLPPETIALIALQKQHKLTLTLLYVSATVAFVIGSVFGFFIHHYYVKPARFNQLAGSAGANEIAGTLYYLNENGERRADVDAVIIFLPKNQQPSQRFPCQGLRPDDEVNHNTVRDIQEIGGMYARADANGSFTLPYQEGVRYLVVLISSHQKRSGEMKPSVRQELRRYFDNPELFGENRLDTDEYELSEGKYLLRHIFKSGD